MGMTIDEIEQWERKNKTVKVLEEKWLLAQETMRKYQKIEQILDDCDLEAWEVLEMIRKVVEDGECKS
jgi:hypothetical protein